MSRRGITNETTRRNVFRGLNAPRIFKLLLAVRLWTFLAAMTLSFTFGIWWCRYVLSSPSGKHVCNELLRLKLPRPPTLNGELRTRQLLFIGVMTSRKFLATRAKGVYDTWANNVPGRIIFFAGGGPTMPRNNLPVVYLPVPDDVHPPQRKALAMLRYIHDNFIDHFQWFVRADDDVYMRSRELVVFLQKFNSSEPLLFGQAGVGKPQERGKLGIRDGDNFCMGGPGIIMSRGVLKKVAPHLTFCSKNTATFHEDTELGRCLRNFAGVMCPWAYEARGLFHQVYENQNKAYHGSLSSPIINDAITLHPVKDPQYMRRIHVHYLAFEIQSLNNRMSTLRYHLENLHKTSEKKSINSSFLQNVDFYGHLPRHRIAAWETFYSRKIFPTRQKAPIRWIHDSIRGGLLKVVRQAKRRIQFYGASQLYHSVRFTKEILGYLNFHPILGLQYIIHLSTVDTIQVHEMGVPKQSTTKHLLKFQQPFSELFCRSIEGEDHKPTVHVIVPLAGRLINFRRFLKSFEKAFLRHGNGNVKLLVVYFRKLQDAHEHMKVWRMYKMKYPADVFHWLNVYTDSFQRGLALNLGSRYFGENALLSISDVDLVFQSEYLHRCRENTKRGEKVYFPIMFSQFHPNISRKTYRNPFVFKEDDGIWRIYSYGPVCVYASDLIAVGGFNTTIKGWGLEDVEFFEKFVKGTKMTVFRSPDRGLVHVYHAHAPCSPNSTLQQQKMCHAAKAAYMTSASSALEYLMKKRYLNRKYFS